MAANEVDELAGTDWKITWKLVKTRRFDSKAFKATHANSFGNRVIAGEIHRFLTAQ